MPRSLVLPLALVAALAAPLAHGQKEVLPKPETYLCPNAASEKAVDCFLNAVEHLYTMCRQVKSIEIIEFGYERSDEGVNNAKTEYCIDKHKLSMTRPYQAALREATGSRSAVDGLRGLHEVWISSLIELKWKPGETDAQYKERIGKPYEVFRERAVVIRTAMVPADPKTKVATTKATTATPKAKAVAPASTATADAKAKPAAATAPATDTKAKPAAATAAPKSTN